MDRLQQEEKQWVGDDHPEGAEIRSVRNDHSVKLRVTDLHR